MIFNIFSYLRHFASTNFVQKFFIKISFGSFCNTLVYNVDLKIIIRWTYEEIIMSYTEEVYEESRTESKMSLNSIRQ